MIQRVRTQLELFKEAQLNAARAGPLPKMPRERKPKERKQPPALYMPPGAGTDEQYIVAPTMLGMGITSDGNPALVAIRYSLTGPGLIYTLRKDSGRVLVSGHGESAYPILILEPDGKGAAGSSRIITNSFYFDTLQAPLAAIGARIKGGQAFLITLKPEERREVEIDGQEYKMCMMSSLGVLYRPEEGTLFLQSGVISPSSVLLEEIPEGTFYFKLSRAIRERFWGASRGASRLHFGQNLEARPVGNLESIDPHDIVSEAHEKRPEEYRAVEVIGKSFEPRFLCGTAAIYRDGEWEVGVLHQDDLQASPDPSSS